MENIFIFIIIMIISSLISKNKKKKAAQSDSEREKPAAYQNKDRNSTANENKPVKSLRDLLDQLKNIETEKANPVPAVPSPAYEKNYEENFNENFEEVSQTHHSHTEYQPQNFSYEEHSKNYKQKPDKQAEKYEDSVVFEKMKMPETIEEIMSADRKKPVRKTIFKSGFSIKNAIIASEILNRKYT
jgi:hypothetical protein